jgi:hypothetical protein
VTARLLAPDQDSPQAVTILTERELEMVSAAGGKKGGTPEFRN